MTSLATTHLVFNSGCSPNATLLDALPEEIVVRILEWCDIGGMLACQRVRLVHCPRFFGRAHSHINGNGDNNGMSNHLPPTVDLSRFQKHNRRLGDPAL